MKVHHQILSTMFSYFSQNLVTSHPLLCHNSSPGHHCLLPRLLQWLLSHFSLAASLLTEYSEWSFENICHSSAQKGLKNPSPISLTYFPSLPFAYIVPSLLVFFLFLEHNVPASTSGPLHLLFPLPEMQFLEVFHTFILLNPHVSLIERTTYPDYFILNSTAMTPFFFVLHYYSSENLSLWHTIYSVCLRILHCLLPTKVKFR